MSELAIVASGPIDVAAEETLNPYGPLVVAPEGSENVLLPLMARAQALIVRGGGVATKTMIDAAPYLRVIGRSGAGYDSVDVRAATERGIPVVYVPGAGARAVAEAGVALILALAKNLFYWDHETKAGNWKSRYRSNPKDVSGSVIGIVGFGSIGSTLAELLRPFRARLLAYDPMVPPEKGRDAGVELTTLEDLLHLSDFVSLHAPLNTETRGMMNHASFQRMKPGAFLINLARGGLIESLDVLYEFLRDGRIAGAALDVFEPEPPDCSHPIFQLPNLITAPHALGMTEGTMRQIFKSMAMDMASVLAGQRPRSVVNPEVLAVTSAQDRCKDD
jgi:D-3-phosphoglycerate dehydrogenase / 2-oxoglutarate reductase